jgi:hypothetical protein
MPLVDRIEKRVSPTFMLMSYSGRVTLINSLLTSIATFTMCSIQLNPKILEHIEKIRRHCLWVKKLDDGEEKCCSLASWQMVSRPKKKGGLGILNLKLQNEVLLLKYTCISSIIKLILLGFTYYGIPIIRGKFHMPWILLALSGGKTYVN